MQGEREARVAPGRRVIVASADGEVRQRLAMSLRAMRWEVREAAGGAEAMGLLDAQAPDALLLDEWLPDLEMSEFVESLGRLYSGVEVLRLGGALVEGETRGPLRHELLQAMREAQRGSAVGKAAEKGAGKQFASHLSDDKAVAKMGHPEGVGALRPVVSAIAMEGEPTSALEGMIGESAVVQELVRLIRLVAPRQTTVLIEGETGTGKELVALALHRLSVRAKKPFVVLNCAAIPEALLEAELFGHTRGAFTGAVQSRTGRIEAADGGTLFLDEIGEMPLGLQAKMLRFLESGELQRVGENELIQVDVRIVAATHQHLEKRAAEGSFRLDLYHRLAVFPLEVPALRERRDDIVLLAEHFLERLGRSAPRKRLSASALEVLKGHAWPGNVRELAHVLERATILAGDSAVLRVEEIRLRGGRR
jgi:DNA-binding NtrC family response regulator